MSNDNPPTRPSTDRDAHTGIDSGTYGTDGTGFGSLPEDLDASDENRVGDSPSGDAADASADAGATAHLTGNPQTGEAGGGGPTGDLGTGDTERGDIDAPVSRDIGGGMGGFEREAESGDSDR